MTGMLELRNWQLRFYFGPDVHKITEIKENLCRDGQDSDQVFMEYNYRIAVSLTQNCLGNKIEKNELSGHVARMGERRGVYIVSVGKPEGKRSLGRPMRRWEDNIKKDLQDLGWGLGLNRAGSG
jgi:hypothetical protein